jgi:DUF4097 and DUF4098 domain-containing protein YvlB
MEFLQVPLAFSGTAPSGRGSVTLAKGHWITGGFDRRCYHSSGSTVQSGMVYLLILASVAAAADPTTFTRTFVVSGPVDLSISTGAGGITIKPGHSSAVEIRGTIHANGDWRSGHQREIDAVAANPPIEQSGNTIRTITIADEWTRRHISISYEITTPATTKLYAHSGAGNISVEGIQGPVDAATGAGSMRITQVKGEVKARSGAGAIEGRQLGGAIDATTDAGKVDLEQTAAAPVKAHTGSGSLALRVPPQAAFDLAVHTGWGKITVDPPLSLSGTIDHRHIKGKVRGGGPLVELSSGAGSVHVQ